MAKHPSSDVTVTLDAVDITDFILNGIDVNTMSEMIDATPVGQAARRRLPVGLNDAEVSQIEGFHDDTATTGSHAVLGTLDTDPNGTPKSLVLVFGGTGATLTIPVWLSQYRMGIQVGDLVKFQSQMIVEGQYVWS